MSDPCFRAVLLDFDRTLFRFDDSAGWLRVALERLGRTPSPADVDRLYEQIVTARARPDVIEAHRGCQRSSSAHHAAHLMWFRGAGADRAVADALYRRLTDPAGWTPYNDVQRTLAWLKERGLKVAVVSNVGWDIRPTFEHHGLGGLVDDFALSCEHGSEKPEQALFLAACSALGVRPDRALMVGDDPVNDGSAVRSGLHVYLLPDQPMGGRRGLDPVRDLVYRRDRLDGSTPGAPGC